MSRRTRRSTQLEQETVPLEHVARILSFADIFVLVNGAALVCKRWHTVVRTEATAWITAINDLDPCAVLGPATILKAAETLKKQGGWLQLAKRLATRGCARKGCGGDTGWVELNTLRRSCSRHAGKDAARVIVLNSFIYDNTPSYTVRNGEELEQALKDSQFGDCIEIAGYIVWQNREFCPHICGVRLRGATNTASGFPTASLVSPFGSVVGVNSIFENLNLTSGQSFEDLFCFDEDEYYECIDVPNIEHFPGVMVYQAPNIDPVLSVILDNCRVWAHQVIVAKGQRCLERCTSADCMRVRCVCVLCASPPVIRALLL